MLHCWRGGIRSQSFAWLLSTAGFKVYTLKKGYKAYRDLLLNSFNNRADIIVLGGMTGSGKTDILRYLSKSGNQVLDLEEIANHKGSAFGHLGQEQQPTTEQFQNDLYDTWRKFDMNKPIWIEDESQAIGSVRIPDPLFLLMRSSPVIKIEISREIRAKRLVKEYASFSNEQLRKAILGIEKRLGGLNTKKAITALEEQDHLSVANITLQYYDKAYNYGISKRDTDSIFPIRFGKDDPRQNAKHIEKFVRKVNSN
ncbi:MAG: tRNA 2-selenouridine(34) synthase MnmH [Bacteroidota bacterium]